MASNNICGAIYTGLKHFDTAINSYKKALKIKPDYAETHYNMGAVLVGKGDPSAAIDSDNKALTIKPNYAEAHYNIGVALKDKDDLYAAISSYREALKIRPDYVNVHRNLSNVTKYTAKNVHFLEIQRLYQGETLTDAARCNLSFALAKAREDLGEYKKAFSYFFKGNTLRKKLLSYTINQD